jgi:uncharacterized protein (TIGR00290 family)
VSGARKVAFASWSGGKDSCLAVARAKQAGIEVRTLLTMFEESGERSRSHGLPRELLHAQARAMGCEWRWRATTWKSYEREFVDELHALRSSGHTQGVFGDIDLAAHREWEEKVCGAAGIEALLPLWHQPRLELAREFWDAGFKALVVCTDDRFLSHDYCGREFDRAFVASLPSGVDACGENGEFHTFVYDGPTFSRAVDFDLAGFSPYTAPAEFGGAGYCFADLRPRAAHVLAPAG